MNRPLWALAGIALLGTAGVTSAIIAPSGGVDSLAAPPDAASPANQSSTVRLTFARAGMPATVRLSREISVLSANGRPCITSSVLGPIDSSGYTTRWPLPHGPQQPEPCSDGPPTRLRFEFTPIEGGPNHEKDFKAEYLWNGGEITAQIEVPSLITLRFVSDSQPRPLLLTSPFARLFADGQDCRPPLFRGDYTITQYSAVWPFPALPDALQTPCTSGRPVKLRFEFDTNVGTVVSEFT